MKNKISKKNIEIIDLFCGTGGLTCGLKKAGLNVVAGIDNNKTCELAYRNNNKTKFILQDIRKITPKDINEIYSKNAFKILVGCAPCQPFSLLRTKMRDKNVQDEKYNLLLEFGRLIKEVKPDIISMENVPQIKNTIIFEKFLKILNDCGYNEIVYKIVYCPNYGIPQKRKRLVLLSSLHGKINLIEPINVDKMPTVKKFIFNLPSIKAGEQSLLDSLHWSANLTELNLKRIKISKPGGTWRDWPKNLRCQCHKKNSGQSFTSPYSRMEWNKIGPTITTEFFSYGTGRFGHPEQNRAISLREGALLQTFPSNYQFIFKENKNSFNDIARQIGNAVPPRLGKIIGMSIIKHLQDQNVI